MDSDGPADPIGQQSFPQANAASSQGVGASKGNRIGTYFNHEGAVMRWLFRRRPAPIPPPNLTALAEEAFAQGALAGVECERGRCKAILQDPAADLNRASAELLAFGTNMEPAAAIRLLIELANLSEAQNRAGPDAAHYVQAARIITERKSDL